MHARAAKLLTAIATVRNRAAAVVSAMTAESSASDCRPGGSLHRARVHLPLAQNRRFVACAGGLLELRAGSAFDATLAVRPGAVTHRRPVHDAEVRIGRGLRPSAGAA